MVSEISSYLVQTAAALMSLLLLLRFLLHQARADFRNPVSQFVVKATNPALVPLRRVIPGLWGIDLAAVLLLLAVQMLALALTLWLQGLGLPGAPRLLAWAALSVVGLTLNFYFFAILAVIILSWVAPGNRHPVAHLLHQVTEPVMAPCRRLLPAVGGFDLSPILVFVAINVLQIMLRHAAVGIGLSPALVFGL